MTASALFVAAAIAATLLVWVGLRHRAASARDRVIEGLRQPDPVARLAALGQIEREGVATHASALVAQLVYERDALVLARLRELVRNSQWEPTSSESVLALRQWAVGGAAAVAPRHPRADAPAPRSTAGPSGQVRELSTALGEDLTRLVLHDDELTVEYGTQADRERQRWNG
jgi:hypothetical protein